jgi:hypothetical protein
MGYLGDLSTDFVQVTKELNMKCDMAALNAYLAEKQLEASDGTKDDEGGLNKCSWGETDSELWYGAPPKVEIQYDPVNKWILSVRLDVDRKKLKVDDPGGMDEEEWAASHFVEQLREKGVLYSKAANRAKLGETLSAN